MTREGCQNGQPFFVKWLFSRNLDRYVIQLSSAQSFENLMQKLLLFFNVTNILMKQILVFTKDEDSARHYAPFQSRKDILVRFCYSANEVLILMMQNVFDLVVCDLDLDTMNFRSILRLNKSGAFSNSAEVLSVISQSDAIPDGELFNGFIRTPFTSQELLEKCDAFLS